MTDDGFLKMPSGMFNRLNVTQDVLMKLDEMEEVEYGLFES
jgi:hypothetical protein